MGEPGALEKLTVVSGVATGKRARFERPPPGAGLRTVIEAVPAVAMLDGDTVAVSWWLLTNVVGSAVPLKLTFAPEMKPVPLTVRVKPEPPGVAVSGINGWLTKGTGFPGGALEKIWMLRKPSSAQRPYASVTFASKYHVPPPVGVPVIAPVLVLRLRPLGSAPIGRDQVNGGLPPVKAII